jgi:hypothetical protein
MKSRKLDLEALEDRRVPASFTGPAPLAEPMTNQVSVVVTTPEPAPAHTLTTLAGLPTVAASTTAARRRPSAATVGSTSQSFGRREFV